MDNKQNSETKLQTVRTLKKCFIKIKLKEIYFLNFREDILHAYFYFEVTNTYIHYSQKTIYHIWNYIKNQLTKP